MDNNIKLLKEKNVYWFLIDGLSPKFLNTCGNREVEYNFFDQLLEKGIVFMNVASAGGGTHNCMHAVFSSMLPSVNGASGWLLEALRRFNENIYTIADLFRMSGYTTFRYCDADGERAVPMSGFQVWESSGYNIWQVLDTTDMMDTVRRDDFIKIVNESKAPKFVYHHDLLLHELNPKTSKDGRWKIEDYINNIKIAANKFERLYNKYDISSDDILILSSDHGCVWDKDWVKDGIENGDRHYEDSVQTFFAIINPNLEPCLIDKLISAIDEGPTITDICLGKKMYGMGISRKEMITDGDYVRRIVCREKGTICAYEKDKNPYESEIYYLRDGNWKYVYGTKDLRCEWLIDLSSDTDYTINRKDENEELVKKYRNYLEEMMIHPVHSVESIYEKYKVPDKKDMVIPFFSIIIEECVEDERVEESLLDLAGPYYELIYKNGDITSKKGKSYKQHYYEAFELDDDVVCGEWIVIIKGDKEYSEYMLSDIYRQIICENKECFSFDGGKVIKKGTHYADSSILHFEKIVRGYMEKEKWRLDSYIDNYPGDKSVLCLLYCNYLLSTHGLEDDYFEEVCKLIPEMNIAYEKYDDTDKYIIYPAGVFGRKVKEYLGDQAVLYADGDIEKIGTKIDGMEVISPKNIGQYKDYKVVLSIRRNNLYNILAYLKEIGCSGCLLCYKLPEIDLDDRNKLEKR